MNDSPSFHIDPVQTATDLEAIVCLWRAYADSLPVSLDFQGFAAEMLAMPGRYAPPAGELLLARTAGDDTPIGCVGLRALTPGDCCEMKRLYVSPAARGLGVGQGLVTAVIDTAKRFGYREMKLDSLPDMYAALAMYKKEGFVPIPRYYGNPHEALYFSLALRADSS